jgi:hypothetical protein
MYRLWNFNQIKNILNFDVPNHFLTNLFLEGCYGGYVLWIFWSRTLLIHILGGCIYNILKDNLDGILFFKGNSFNKYSLIMNFQSSSLWFIKGPQ